MQGIGANAPPARGPVKATSAAAIVLLLHDGELADVAALLHELQLSTLERRGTPTLEDRQQPWELVIATPRRLQELGAGGPGGCGVRIAVVNQDSKTLRAMLGRIGVDYTVRRPVHPTALRLLLIHAVYRGPERRRTRRVHIGAPVRFRAGLRRREAILADLSITGCRLLAPISLSRSRRLQVRLPLDPARGQTFAVSGRVIRSAAAPEEAPGTQMIAVHFERPSRRTIRKLSDAVQRYGAGPAMLDRKLVAATRPAPAPAAPRHEPVAAARPCDAVGDGGERRAAPRRSLDRRIVALSGEATKVLMGRDISLGGMRVAPVPGLGVGDCLNLALHVRAREAPLVVETEVVRDEGEHGLVLSFRNLDRAARGYLENMVKFLPILASHDGDGNEGVIVSEIVERLEA
jgi:hypothetical protein